MTWQIYVIIGLGITNTVTGIVLALWAQRERYTDRDARALEKRVLDLEDAVGHLQRIVADIDSYLRYTDRNGRYRHGDR